MSEYAQGGVIPGDPVPMPILDVGYVITRAQLEALGTDFLDQLNRIESGDPDEALTDFGADE